MPLPTTCPRCNTGLRRGSIVGQAVYLNWVPEGASVGWITLGSDGQEGLASQRAKRSGWSLTQRFGVNALVRALQV